MLVEIYGVPGAIALGTRFDEEFIGKLIDQTAELRKDPEKREKENAQKALEEFLSNNQGQTIKTVTEDGEEIEIQF